MTLFNNEIDYIRRLQIAPVRYDVVVVGGGTAGCCAAIASAMGGAGTLIVENACFLGGSASGGQVMPMMDSGVVKERESSVINLLLKSGMGREGYGAADRNGNDGWFNPEMLKFFLEDMYTGYGGHILYDTRFIDSVVRDGNIDGIIVSNRGGLKAIGAKYFIDCTGDADVAFRSGVPCFKGDGPDHANQALTLRFMLGNIDLHRMSRYLKDIGETTLLEYPLIEIAASWQDSNALSDIFRKGLEEGILKKEDGKYFQAFTVPGMEGVMSFNCPEIPEVCNALRPEDINEALITGRRMVKRLHKFLKAYIPGFENSFILSTASMPGIRESRRIKGKFVLTGGHYAEGARFEDAIARSAYPIDIHHAKHEKGLEMRAMDRGEFFEVPFRCLMPENIKNLLVAGRCISSTFSAQSSIRIQAVCRATGEAAGTAAAYCVKSGVSLSRIDGKIIRKIMEDRVAQGDV